jgi:hypothetical protein
LAAEVQQGILPRSIPQVPGFDFAARMYPAKIVAGDYYGFIEFPAGRLSLMSCVLSEYVGFLLCIMVSFVHSGMNYRAVQSNTCRIQV